MISASEHANYSKQYDLMSRICAEFESETEADSEEVKGQRFERVIDLMQQMQSCGQPPKDIVGDMVSHGHTG